MEKIWFQLVVEPDTEDGGYVATTPTLPGVAGQGESPDEAARDLAAALQFTLDDMKENGEPLPESDEKAYDLPLLDEAPRAYSKAMVVQLPKLPVVSGAEAISAFEDFGYRRVRIKGDHVRLKCEGRKPITVPLHDPVKRGLLRSLIRDAGLTVEEFNEALQENR